MKKLSIFFIVGFLSISVPAQQEETALYYQSVDYSSIACPTAREAIVANVVSHGFGNSVMASKWLEEALSTKKCTTIIPGQQFLVSPATAWYMRSTNSVAWAVQIISPSNPKKTFGYIPLDYIRFIPIPTL